MNLFEKAKLKGEKYLCLNCGKVFTPDKRNLKRGWGLFCSKGCTCQFNNKLKTMSKDDAKFEIRNKKLVKLGIR